MVKAMEAARAAARKAIEHTYEGSCCIMEYVSVTDEKTKITRCQEMPALRDQPCRLSFEKINAAVPDGAAAKLSQGVKLFVAPEAVIRPGSKIVVTQNGVTGEYAASGPPAVYPSHQEILLERFRGWA